jgi:hypothetical protein
MMVVGKRSTLLLIGLFIIMFAASCSSTPAASTTASSHKGSGDHFNAPGNILIYEGGDYRGVASSPILAFTWVPFWALPHIKCACLLFVDGNLVLYCSRKKNSSEERGERRWKGRHFCPCVKDSILSE